MLMTRCPAARPGGREIGRKGGLLAAQRMSPEQRQERAAKGGNTTLRLYGLGFYSALGSKRYLGEKKTVQ